MSGASTLVSFAVQVAVWAGLVMLVSYAQTMADAFEGGLLVELVARNLGSFLYSLSIDR